MFFRENPSTPFLTQVSQGSSSTSWLLFAALAISSQPLVSSWSLPVGGLRCSSFVTGMSGRAHSPSSGACVGPTMQLKSTRPGKDDGKKAKKKAAAAKPKADSSAPARQTSAGVVNAWPQRGCRHGRHRSLLTCACSLHYHAHVISCTRAANHPHPRPGK